MGRVSSVGAWIGLAIALSVTAHARADARLTLQAPTQLAVPNGPEVFRYVEPQQANYLRAVLEEIALLGLGLGQYLSNHQANSVDFDFGYDWVSFRRKITGEGYSLDTNKFDTNFITHPGSGTLYYWAARGNRLNVLESFVFAFVASALWEYLGEFRERVSINDVLVTPIAGLVLGETTIQLGAFFDQSCATPQNKALGTFVSPFKSLHDALDGAKPLRDTQCDRYGLSRTGEHEFRFSVDAGALTVAHGPHDVTRAETRLGLHTRVIALPAYGTPGSGYTKFAAGNITELSVDGALTGAGWTDFRLRATVIPAGIHYRSVSTGAAGIIGDELVFGLLLGTEYNVHRFGIGAEPLDDRFFALDVPALSLSYRRLMGGARLVLELQTGVSLAGVDAFAMPQYLTRNSGSGLTTVQRSHGYNYAAGMRINPRARLIWNGFEAGADLSATRLWGIHSMDRHPERDYTVSVGELRSGGSAWLRLSPRAWLLGFALTCTVLQRSGTIATSHAARAEVRLMAGIDAPL